MNFCLDRLRRCVLGVVLGVVPGVVVLGVVLGVVRVVLGFPKSSLDDPSPPALELTFGVVCLSFGVAISLQLLTADTLLGDASREVLAEEHAEEEDELPQSLSRVIVEQSVSTCSALSAGETLIDEYEEESPGSRKKSPKSATPPEPSDEQSSEILTSSPSSSIIKSARSALIFATSSSSWNVSSSFSTRLGKYPILPILSLSFLCSNGPSNGSLY